MKIKYFLLLCTFCALVISCAKPSKMEQSNSGKADPKAKAIAESVMSAMGGQKKWDNLHYVSWTFFGNRHLVWDKTGGRARIEIPKDTSIYLIDLNKMTGRYIKGGQEVTNAQEVAEAMKRAKGMWINDSYWTFMPFKLLDNGVTLKYMREDTMLTGAKASVLQLTFDQVGNTPDNKYEVYVDQNHLIKQWAYFKIANQIELPKIWPWDNYKSFDGLLISNERSDKSGPSNVRVYDKLNNSVFESFDKFTFY